jgi:ABC-type phosphate transport system substrate-binding protein
MIRPRRGAPAALAVLVITLAVAGCGVTTDPELVRGEQVAASARETQAAQESQTIANRRDALPKRDANEVAVSVTSRETATAGAVAALQQDDSSVDFSLNVQPTDQGFTDLCSGRVDVLQSSRRISSAELAQCAQNGLSVGRTVTLGYATAVLVTENGRDIGGDCLTLAAVKSMLGAGSTITNWRQIGFGSTGFSAAAPPVTNPTTTVVGIKAFGRPIGGVSQNDFRGDLRTFGVYNTLSDWVTSQDRIELLDRESLDYSRSVARGRRQSDAAAVRRAEEAAARVVVRQIEAENQARIKAKKPVADPEALERSNAARVREAKRQARLKTTRKADDLLEKQTKKYREQRTTAVYNTGRLGVVPYTFYELHSDVLRPLEIDPRTKASDKAPDCRFPSQQTIVNETYPLILPIYLYGDTRVLRTTSVRVLLTRLLTENAELTRGEDLTGLSNTALIRTRRTLGLPQITETTTSEDGTTTTTTTRTAPTVTNATPNIQPGGVPGIASTGTETP